MFKDKAHNIRMLKGAYRKLKSYYYYNKNFLLMRMKIADFEWDHVKMKNSFSEMAEAICHPLSAASKSYFDTLLNAIKFFVIPKKFDTQIAQPNMPVSNTIQRDKKMKTVNFFIVAPIELYIFDTLWTIFVAKMDKDKQLLSFDVYGNTINKSALFGEDDQIAFDSRVLFNRNFEKYTDWRNNAFRAMEKNYDRGKDTVLISLDIRSYFYSVAFSFNKLGNIFEDHELLKKIRPLTRLIESVYDRYLTTILPYRKDLIHLRKKEYPLPIGLFSSMILANIYLNKFDAMARTIAGVKYYGRYVDDILLVVRKSLASDETNQRILEDLLVKPGVFRKAGALYAFVGYRSLYVQPEKIKIIYLDHTESRALIDIYNNTIRVIPSQMDPLPSSQLELSNFDEVAYSIENFEKENKIRDIGFLGVDSFNVGRYFSTLPRRYAHINTFGGDIRKEIDRQIAQIEKFFTGSQTIEYYSNWLNYMYFLVITRRHQQLRKFVSLAKKQIQSLRHSALDNAIYNHVISLNRKAKDTLLVHLDICLEIALSLDVDIAQKHFNAHFPSVKKYICSNMFDHSFVAFPLANYLDYTNYVSFSKMKLSDLGKYPEDITKAFTFIWSPRFIHYDELLLLLFYHFHANNKRGIRFNYIKEKLPEKFATINHLGYVPFEIISDQIFKNEDYFLERIEMPSANTIQPQIVNVAVGSIDITEQKCIQGYERWTNITIKDKELLFGILQETYSCFSNKERGTMILVLPELCYPFYWINDLVRFAKRAQIAIVTGLQYLGDESDQKYNYIATILPFKSGSKGYRNAFVHIREKNDYSPIEFESLAKQGAFCRNRTTAEYQVFYWKGIRLTPIDCFELTDIMARAILKGNSDIIAAAVFNPDTTYFSNIIDSAVRDLHAFIVQANTSHLGDSRVTGPYDRDSKDVFKIKGGDNDHVVIGAIEFRKLKQFQDNYFNQQEKKLRSIEQERKKRNPKYAAKKKEKPDIKPLPARFKNK